MNKLINLLLLLILSFTIWSCKDEPKNFVELSGKVENLEKDIDSIKVFIPNGYTKNIAIAPDGSFQDTLNIEEGKYRFKIGQEYGTIYLKNGEKINLNTDYADFDQKLSFEGNGESAKRSNVEKAILLLKINNLSSEALALNDKAFNAQMDAYRNDYNALKKANSDLPASFWKESDATLEENIAGFTQERSRRLEIKERFTGQAAPSFAMESIDGTTVSLDDFKGKYVYVDVWATWCGPCKREISALKDLEHEYADKRLAVVSMSVDEPKDKEKWKKFVQENNLQGTQIFAENAWKSDFIQKFEINSIPRFILIDPDGKVVSADAPRPSESGLKKLLKTLNL